MRIDKNIIIAACYTLFRGFICCRGIAFAIVLVFICGYELVSGTSVYGGGNSRYIYAFCIYGLGTHVLGMIFCSH